MEDNNPTEKKPTQEEVNKKIVDSLSREDLPHGIFDDTFAGRNPEDISKLNVFSSKKPQTRSLG